MILSLMLTFFVSLYWEICSKFLLFGYLIEFCFASSRTFFSVSRIFLEYYMIFPQSCLSSSSLIFHIFRSFSLFFVHLHKSNDFTLSHFLFFFLHSLYSYHSRWRPNRCYGTIHTNSPHGVGTAIVSKTSDGDRWLKRKTISLATNR